MAIWQQLDYHFLRLRSYMYDKNIFIADAGIEYKYIRREYIDEVITSILSQINV
jgi:hypothetical protein